MLKYLGAFGAPVTSSFDVTVSMAKMEVSSQLFYDLC